MFKVVSDWNYKILRTVYNAYLEIKEFFEEREKKKWKRPYILSLKLKCMFIAQFFVAKSKKKN